MSLRRTLAVSCFGLFTGCLVKASPPHPAPVVDSVSLPPTCAIGTDGAYDLMGTISFHGNTVSVSTIHVSAPALMTDYRIQGTDVPSATNAQLIVNFPPNNAIGTSGTYAISVIDDSGLESAPVTGTVTLE
jgi:hypothetical protein